VSANGLDEVWDDWQDAVNMTAKQLEDWLETDESKSVGQSDGGGEATGHKSGRRIVEILRATKGDLTDDDVQHMRKVVGWASTPRAAPLRRRRGHPVALLADELGPRPDEVARLNRARAGHRPGHPQR
jgi:hypothetical protein